MFHDDDDMEIRALTIQQPWAGLIVAGVKTTENRSWRVGYRGLVLVHAGSSPDLDAPVLDEPVTLGAIVGAVSLVGIVRDCRDKFAEPGCWHWLLADPVPLTPIPCRGALRLWRPAPPVIHAVRAQLANAGSTRDLAAGG